MVARGLGSPKADRFYTYRVLADLWGVKEQTIRLWIMQLRRDGQGPEQGQSCVVQVNAATRILKIRGDYAVFVQRVKIERMK
jgi:transposase-like protein